MLLFQAKRGIAKRPFQLPVFIAATGIEKMRQAYIKKENSKRSKQKQRGCTQPKMGKMDIDYQDLHGAFFKYQTKPNLTSHGDLYYEGKEFEVKLREMKPGMLSRKLKEALGMPDGAPPPWLKSMQVCIQPIIVFLVYITNNAFIISQLTPICLFIFSCMVLHPLILV
uniref:PSP proline-rich domain-containing protein n=1 Tax=Aegilops tauschii subsp. strangulata TaxID=200361 RepID=A0A453NGH9_AEGTS